MRIVCLLFLSALLVFSHQEAAAQALPLQALSDDRLPMTFQAEHLGPSLWTEHRGEEVGHSKFDTLIPFAQSDVDAYAFQLRGSRLRLDRDRVASGTTAVVPQELGSLSAGLFAKRRFDTRDVVAGDVSLGQSGIELGSASSATTVSANIFWARPKGDDGGQWIYLISYSNARSTFNNIPLPGFAYSKAFKAESGQGVWAAGAPFFFGFFRGNPWSGTALITPFASSIEGSYSLLGPFAVFAKFGWQPQGFRVKGGPEERILYEEFRTQLGLRGPVARWALASLGLVYSDGRRIVWGDSLFKSVGSESRLEDELAAIFTLAARF